MIKSKLILLSAIVLAVLTTSCAPRLHHAPTFTEDRAAIKTLAILPFDTNIKVRRLPKGVTAESMRESEKSTGYTVQNNVYSSFLRKRKKYTVDFQDIDKTNALLKKADITYEDLRGKDKAELAEILGVDAVISGKITTSKPMSDGAAIAIVAVFGLWAPTSQADVALTIHNKSGDLQWKYDFRASGSLGTSSERLAKHLMNSVARRFPYKK